MPTMKFRDLDKLLKRNGWAVDHATGSHYIYTHSSKPGTVTVPFHGTNSDLGDSILKSVLKQAGLKS
jgi:predicted RNA binding protein YcfA (HicA-like mRNA interferase family)